MSKAQYCTHQWRTDEPTDHADPTATPEQDRKHLCTELADHTSYSRCRCCCGATTTRPTTEDR